MLICPTIGPDIQISRQVVVEALRLIREELPKMNSGRSPLEEIRRARVSAARQLLAESNLSIAQIARQCGYGSLKGMAQAFHQVVGCKPTAYRSSMRRAPDEML